MMRTESTVKPDTITVRKLGIIDGKPVVYLYFSDNIVHEDDMYLYDMVQVTTLMPVELLPEIDLTLIVDHAYNQTAVKQRAVNHLDKIKTRLGKATAENTRQVDRLDRLSTPKPSIIENIKTIISRTESN